MAGVLGRMMADLVTRDPALQAPLIIPVPLHPRRRRSRGFNQSALLAREIAGRGTSRLDESVLVKVRDTAPQTALSREGRAGNLHGAFEVRGTPEAGRVLLVDDVMSTGATADECARVLRHAGAREVAVVVAAMALPGNAPAGHMTVENRHRSCSLST
jgi:ComF family protein